MSLFFRIFISVLLLADLPSYARAEAPKEAESCECKQSSCGPCEVEVGTDFYSSKCGPGLSQVKSCKKPTCEPVENQKSCLALLKEKSEANESNAVAKRENTESSESAKGRAPAAADLKGAGAAGEVLETAGRGRVIRVRGGKDQIKKGLSLYEGDIVETLADGKVKIGLKDSSDEKLSSELVMAANSRMRIETIRADTPLKMRDVTLKLLSGKLRSRVLQKTSGPTATFRVKTYAAVAGVRGTDFVTTFEPGEKEWTTEVRTLEGKVELGNITGTKKLEIGEGTYAAFTVKTPPRGTDEIEIATLAEEGEMSPLLVLKPDEAALLKELMDLKPQTGASSSANERVVAKANDSLCQAPSGQFNQCSWTCEGKNPKGSKSCRTDLPEVSCVRRLCRANGQWSEATRMPASQSDFCGPGGAIVRDCGSYW